MVSTGYPKTVAPVRPRENSPAVTTKPAIITPVAMRLAIFWAPLMMVTPTRSLTRTPSRSGS